MAHIEKLLNVSSDGCVDSHMFDVLPGSQGRRDAGPADLPSAAALIHPDEVLAAISVLKRKQSSDI